MDEERGVLARVVCAAVGRVVAVVGGDDEEVCVAHRRLDFGEARVEVFEGARVAFRVAAVAVEHVEVNEVREDEAARVCAERRDGLVNRLVVVLAGEFLSDSGGVVDGGDFSDGDNVEARA